MLVTSQITSNRALNDKAVTNKPENKPFPNGLNII